MKSEYIKSFDKRIIGIIEYKDNGDKVARAFPSRKVLGFYEKELDHTTDFYHRVLTRGDTAVALIMQDDERKQKRKKK